jgi:predicted transcriptional regulator
MTAGEVQAALGAGLAYTTILTALTRLHAKHALVREPDGRAYRYALAGDRDEAAANVTAHRMLGLLEGSDRAQVLSRFIAELAPGDGDLLAQLLSEASSTENPTGGDT